MDITGEMWFGVGRKLSLTLITLKDFLYVEIIKIKKPYDAKTMTSKNPIKTALLISA